MRPSRISTLLGPTLSSTSFYRMPSVYILSLKGMKKFTLAKSQKRHWKTRTLYLVGRIQKPPSLKYLDTCHEWFPRPSHSSRFVNVAAAAHVVVGGGHITSQVLARSLAMQCQILGKLFKMWQEIRDKFCVTTHGENFHWLILLAFTLLPIFRNTDKNWFKG